jgi:hypothetical protein
MDYIAKLEKQKCLFIFKTLLDYFNTNVVLPVEVYDNTQPSKSVEKKIYNIIFHDYMLQLCPHILKGTIYDLKSTSRAILSTIIGRLWPTSTYTFKNELDYTNIMKSVGFKVESSTLSQKKLFNDILDNYIGYGLVLKKKNNYVIDAQYLQQFEIRKGYSNLNCIIYLDNKMHFDYCKINGQKRSDDFAIRECITAMTTIVTMKQHLFEIHFLISDNFHLLLNEIDKSNPIYRVLIPTTSNTYKVTENGVITLFGQTGFCSWFNVTRDGLVQYYNYTKQTFKIRDVLIPKQLPGKSAVHKHQHLWFNCIRNFVSEFLAIQPKLDSKDFINVLKKNYDGIYDETKSEMENVIDICTMMIYANIIHESCSNSKLQKSPTNPYTISTSWKQNDSSKLSDKINNLGEQTEANYIAHVTSIEAIRLDDKQWINRCCVNEKEKKIYKKFRTSILNLDIPEDAVLHPKNVSSSISY